MPISNATITLASKSAQFQPNALIKMPAITAATEPSKSPNTCKNAPCIFKLSRSPRSISHATPMFTSKPSTATTSMVVLATATGRNARMMASSTIHPAITISVKPLSAAARISTRW